MTMSEGQRQQVFARMMRRNELAPFAMQSNELRQAIDAFDDHMDVIENTLSGLLSSVIRGKTTNAQQRAMFQEIMQERLNG